MKRILSVLLATIMALSVVPVLAEVTLQGGGTEADPYLIGTEDELVIFRSKVNAGETTACARLTADINLGSAAWKPIGTVGNKYSGIFDGSNFKISGLKGSGTQWGFFAYTSGGEIKNLTIEAGNNGTLNVGHQSALFVAISENNTKITKCAGYGNISVGDGFAGGITSWGDCIVENCYYVGNISGSVNVSGMGMGTAAKNCFVYGNITATTNAFKVANKSAENCYYLSATGGSGAYGYGTQASEEAFKSGEITYSLNGSSEAAVFGQDLSEAGDSHPVFFKSGNRVAKIKDKYSNVADDWAPPSLNGGGTEEDPHLIGNRETLELFRDSVNSGKTNICAKLTADIDLENERWTPIGNATNKYSGIFDGNGYEIKNIVNKGNKWGFFGETDGGAIKNLTIRAGSDGEEENTLSAFGHECGLFVGIASNDTVIDHCAGYGNLTGYGEIGGFTSKGSCIVTNSYFVGDIYGSGNISGMGYGAKAINCFVLGNVDAKGNAFKVCNGGATNCYYLSSTGAGLGGYGTQKSEAAFENGEVAYLLSESFGQLIGKDKHPVWKTEYNAVEAVLNGYSNTYAIPAVSKVDFVRADGAVMNSDSVSMYTDEIIIHFTSQMDETSMKNAVQLDGVEIEGKLSEDKTDYILTVKDGIIPWGNYSLKVKNVATNILGNSLTKDCVVEFTVTDDGENLIITSAVVGDETNLASVKKGEAVNVTIEGYNPKKANQKISVILMGYKTVNGVKEMVSCKIVPVEIPENEVVEIDKTVEIKPTGFTEADEVKLFIWGYPVHTRLTPAIIFN